MPDILEGPDAANTTSTTASMGLGDYFYGTLGSTGDSDWVEVELVAGQTYTFGLTGVGALTDNLTDPYLRLRDSSGAQIAFDDDGGPGRNSSVTFTASSSGTFYLDVQSWDNTEAGDYGLSMVEGTRASYSTEMGAGNLIRADGSWSPTPETAATVTWAIRTSGNEPGGGTPFVAPSAAQVAAIEMALDYISGVAGLTFDQVNPGGTSNNATMLFGAYDANDGSGAYAYFPGSTASSSNAGDVWLNNNSGSTTNLPIGSYSCFTILHEIGHALGLEHPGDYNAAPGVSITYSNNAQFTEDTHQYTVMSYFDEGNTTTSVGGYPDTLMLFDLLALHQQYGADMTFHAGDTVYGFNASVGGAYDFTTNTNPLLSIWDGGGDDTLDMSGYSMDQVITLLAGEFSSVGGFEANMSIAVGATVENAIGGSGDDLIIGNAADNSLSGGNGEDTLVGSAGADDLDGGSGIDTADYSGATSGGGIRLNAFSSDGTPRPGLMNWGFAAGDDLLSIENLIGSAFAETLIGTLGANILWGGGGGDVIWSSSGDDTVYGEDGHDWIRAGNGHDNYSGGIGNDTLDGGRGNDEINGDGGLDSLIGGIGNDTLIGGTGDDTLTGGVGADTMDGGADTDTVDYSGALSGGVIRLDIYDDEGNQLITSTNWGYAANDTLISIENLIGSGFNETLVGTTGANVLWGGGGNDVIWSSGGNDTVFGQDGDDNIRAGGGDDTYSGGAGADTLNGGGGNDTLSGDGDSDTFIFQADFGDDVITDFDANDDLEQIDLSGVAAIESLADLTANHLSQSGGNVIIDDGLGNTITLNGVLIGDLGENDFIFA